MRASNGILSDLWDAVRSDRDKLLAVDYDGTLAPFKADRMKAIPLPGAVDLLLNINDLPGTTVAVVSGRPVDELVTLLGPLPLQMVGSHGWQVRRSDGALDEFFPEADQAYGLDSAEKLALEMTDAGRIERKIASLALHTRGLNEERAALLQDKFFEGCNRFAAAKRLDCRRFNGGVEVRAVGKDKGTALTRLIARQPEDALVVYIGDDQTDEDAFSLIKDKGFGIKVGGQQGDTAAGIQIADCRAVVDLLCKWSGIYQTSERLDRET